MKFDIIEPAVSIEALTKRFGLAWAINGIDLRVRQGEVLAVFGPNGAGKTTLIRILSTLTRPTSGRLKLLGHDPEKEGEKLRRAIGVLTHAPLLFDHLTAWENLKFYGQMFEVKNLKERMEGLLHDVGLKEHREQRVGTFSRGMQQRLAIARALLHEPHLLLLDEPHTGLDQDGILFLTDTLRGFASAGNTIVMTCHDFDRGLELCSKVAILNRGRLAYYGDPANMEGNFEGLYKKSVGKGA